MGARYETVLQRHTPNLIKIRPGETSNPFQAGHECTSQIDNPTASKADLDEAPKDDFLYLADSKKQFILYRVLPGKSSRMLKLEHLKAGGRTQVST